MQPSINRSTTESLQPSEATFNIYDDVEENDGSPAHTTLDDFDEVQAESAVAAPAREKTTIEECNDKLEVLARKYGLQDLEILPYTRSTGFRYRLLAELLIAGDNSYDMWRWRLELRSNLALLWILYTPNHPEQIIDEKRDWIGDFVACLEDIVDVNNAQLMLLTCSMLGSYLDLGQADNSIPVCLAHDLISTTYQALWTTNSGERVDSGLPSFSVHGGLSESTLCTATTLLESLQLTHVGTYAIVHPYQFRMSQQQRYQFNELLSQFEQCTSIDVRDRRISLEILVLFCATYQPSELSMVLDEIRSMEGLTLDVNSSLERKCLNCVASAIWRRGEVTIRIKHAMCQLGLTPEFREYLYQVLHAVKLFEAVFEEDAIEVDYLWNT